MSELKPCPFCGSGAIEVSAWEEYTKIGCLDCDYGIRCQDCDEEDAVDYWNTRPAEDAKDREIERLKVHCNALHDCLFILQKLHEELMGNDELPEDAKDAQLEFVTNIVKVLATSRFHGIKGTICPNCESRDCSKCDIDTIIAIQERIANAPDSTKGVEK